MCIRIMATSLALALIPVLCTVADDFVVGGDRPVTIYVPATYDPEVPAPLLLLLHGYAGSGAGTESLLRFRPLADQYGFLLAHPEGTRETGVPPNKICGFTIPPNVRFWNGTEGCDFNNRGIDDSGYLRAVIEAVRGLRKVDQDRIYLVGLSCGGNMSYRMACDHAETIAAIASLGGFTFLDPEECAPASSVHILEVRGKDDTCVLYGGGSFFPGNPYPSAVATVEQWATFNGCSLERKLEDQRLDLDVDVAGEETTVKRYDCGPSGSVELWTIEGAGHVPSFCMPDRNELCPRTANGAMTTTFAVHVWDWLLTHPKRPTPQASFTVEPKVGPAPLEVTLDGTSSTAPEGTDIARYLWDLGDSKRAEGATVDHTYTHAGEYLISLAVMTDDNRVSLKTTRSVTVRFDPEPFPPWTSEDIGNPTFPGGSRFRDNCLQISGAPGTIMGRSDVCHFTHQKITDDFRLTARIVNWRVENLRSSLALMMRESLEPGARQGSVTLEKLAAGFKHRFLRRESPDGTVRARPGDTYEHLDLWLRLERHGNVVSGILSLDSESWTDPDTAELADLSQEVYVGVASSYIPSLDGGGAASLATICDLVLVPLGNFRRGDCNDDGAVDISDAVFSLGSLFLGDGIPGCNDACDSNDDGVVDISDAIATLGVLFLGNGVIPLPGMIECGVDPTNDQIGCVTFSQCP